MVILATFLFLLLQQNAPAVHAAAVTTQNLSTLVKEYDSLPTLPQESFIEGLMNNPIMSAHLNSPTEVEKAIIRKQILIGQIFKQAILEIQDPSALARLLLTGAYSEPGAGTTLQIPSIHRISNIKTIFELIALLLQCAEEEKVLALDILRAKGPKYPSTDSFARGLARFAAESAVDAEMFDQILQQFDVLYVLKAKHPHPPGESSHNQYYIGSIAGEISDAGYNPAIGNPVSKAKVIAHIFDQIHKRNSGPSPHENPIRLDLIQGLAAMSDQEDVEKFIREILRHSQNIPEVSAAVRGLYRRHDKKTFMLAYENLDRLQILDPIPGYDRIDLVQYAVKGMIDPFVRPVETTDPNATALKDEMLLLFGHSNPFVRMWSVRALGWEGWDHAFVRTQMLSFLSDTHREVRREALQYISRHLIDRTEFDARIQEIEQSDSDEGIRVFAKEVQEKIATFPHKRHSGCGTLAE